MVLKFSPWGDDPNFEWDEFNEYEISQHQINCFEVEQCFENEHWIAPHNRVRSAPEKYGDRYLIKGITNGGKKLFIVVQYKGANVVRPITVFLRR